MSLNPVRNSPPQGSLSAQGVGEISNGVKFFDAHTHVQFVAFNSDYKEVIARAFEAGVGMVNVGTEKNTSLKAIKFTEEYPENVYAAVGLHPSHTFKPYFDSQELSSKKEEGEYLDYNFYRNLALNKKVVAIGECGLDYFRIKNNELGIKNKQQEAFIKQIELAHEVKKPLMIHCRDAYADLIEILKINSSKLNPIPGIVHFFSGTKDNARELLNLGFYFTFGGVITFPPRLAERSRGEAGTRDYDEVIKFVPMDRILSETDAPYVAPVPYRGKRNEPVYVIEVVKKLAEIKRIELEKMCEQILKNTKTIFQLE